MHLSIVAIALHAIIASVVALILARKLRKSHSLRFPVSTAIFLMLSSGVLLGVLMNVAQKERLGEVVILTPLPIWIIAGSEWLTLRRKVAMIAVREAVTGAIIGASVYGVITSALFAFMRFSG